MSKTENGIHLRCASFRRRQSTGRAVLLALILLLIPALMSSSSRWQVVTMAQKDESLFNRIVRAIEVKEPKWKLAMKDERKGAEQKYFTHDWALGEEYVSTSTHQMIDTAQATKDIREFIRSPVSVPVHITEVPDLGDEAYTIGDSPYGKHGAGTLVVRRVNIMIRLDASSLLTAKRFAKHMLDEVDAMCGGALCEPMTSDVESNR